jgi:hypothetical protein
VIIRDIGAVGLLTVVLAGCGGTKPPGTGSVEINGPCVSKDDCKPGLSLICVGEPATCRRQCNEITDCPASLTCREHLCSPCERDFDCAGAALCKQGACTDTCNGGDADCKSIGFCDSSATCVLDLAVGETCDRAAQCATGRCIGTVCAVSSCGDGVMPEDSKFCDDGLGVNSDLWSLVAHCNAACTALALHCGDSVVTTPEKCDSGPKNSNDYGVAKHCNADCSGWAPYCGDNVIQGPDELCDDGAPSAAWDGCSFNCQFTDKQLNTTASQDQINPALAVLSDARYIGLWEDSNTLLGVLVGPDNRTLTPLTPLPPAPPAHRFAIPGGDTGTGHRGASIVTWPGSTKVLVAFDKPNSGNNRDVYYSMLSVDNATDVSGTGPYPLFAAGLLGNQRNARATGWVASTNRAAIVFEDAGDSPTPQPATLKGKLFDEAGGAGGTLGSVLNISGGGTLSHTTPIQPAVANWTANVDDGLFYNLAPGFAVAWSDNTTRISLRRFNRDGSIQMAAYGSSSDPNVGRLPIDDFVVSGCTGTIPNHELPAMASHPDGYLNIAWIAHDATTAHVLTRLVKPNNTMPGAGSDCVEVASFPMAGATLYAPAVVAYGTGATKYSFAVVWSNGQTGSGDIYVRFFTFNNASYQPEALDTGATFVVNDYNDGTHPSSGQVQPQAALSPDGYFVYGWMSYGQDGDGAGVFATKR